MKESNPVEVAEYARARSVDDEPAFAWWVPYTLKKRDIIIGTIKARVKKSTHKYGVKIPRTIKEVYMFDEENGNTFWRDAIAKEMHSIGIAFQILEEDESLPVGFSKVTRHIIFDVEKQGGYLMDIEPLTQKAPHMLV